MPGGVAVIISPYSWLEEYTAQEHWLGGVVRGGDSVSSAPALAEAMEALGFALVEQFDMPFLIREHGAHPCAAFLATSRAGLTRPMQRASSSGGAATPPCGAWASPASPKSPEGNRAQRKRTPALGCQAQ